MHLNPLIISLVFIGGSAILAAIAKRMENKDNRKPLQGGDPRYEA